MTIIRQFIRRKHFFITTPIFYANAQFTSRCQLLIQIQKAAQAAGLAPEVFCDRLSGSFRELFKTFRIQPTDFIRTTEHRHKRVVEQIWTKLRKRGFIKKAKYSGWYSIVDECFYSEHEIETVKSHVNGQQQKV
ncbi:unnamed protein product [Anisakis simplex]|uniref:Methionine--tRNA ligase, mitochondrial (inferred by orthology to a human protein) n=1 Tax=Anisakis simplex TaxID=6269 RepID=A0A0M3K424_ANISI|nr:unnamed protein product [Anisakis simplex]